MSTDLALILALTAAGLLGVALMITPAPPVEARPRRGFSLDSRTVARAGAAAIVSLLVLALSGWMVPSLICGVATWVAAAAIARRGGRTNDVERIDALASWIENLRDVLLAGEQPVGAIRATVDSCPDSIRSAVRRLAAALGHQDPEVAFRRFADDIDDPLGDLVAAGLLIAVQRGARTVAVLTALAEQARTQADRRRIIEAERAPLQREVTILTVIATMFLLLSRPDVRRVEVLGVVSGGLMLTVLIARVAEKLRRWIDRRFFREAYDAERILSDLSEQVRTIVETGPLLETVARRIAESLHIERVVFLVEEMGADVNARDANGYTALHHAASRGDVEMIRYLVEKGADVTVVSRKGETTADMANGPIQRVRPYPEAIALLESLGSENNQNCLSCE